jgi:hypothetical protein
LRSLDRIRLALLFTATLVVVGCSSDIAQQRVNSPAKIFAVPDWAQFRSSSDKPRGQRPVTADDLVSAEGVCSGADTTVAPATPQPGQEGGAPAPETRGIGLEMTECQVVRRVGKPDRVEIGADPGGQRATVITYLQGVRPGIYHFVNGRLKQVEAAPEPPAAAKPQKPPKRKPKTATAN